MQAKPLKTVLLLEAEYGQMEEFCGYVGGNGSVIGPIVNNRQNYEYTTFYVNPTKAFADSKQKKLTPTIFCAPNTMLRQKWLDAIAKTVKEDTFGEEIALSSPKPRRSMGIGSSPAFGAANPNSENGKKTDDDFFASVLSQVNLQGTDANTSTPTSNINTTTSSSSSSSSSS